MQSPTRLPLRYDELAALSRPIGRRAVVVGASMTGLLAASVLCRHFDEVWLLDRDTLPARAEHRRATPQSRHAHLLLARGAEAIEALLPDITGEWVGLGARLADMHSEIAFHGGKHAFAQAASGAFAVAASRPLLESVVRQRVLALDNVYAATGIDVQGLRVDSRGRVNGVYLGSLGEEDWPIDFHATLVLDASGRSSRMPMWLRELGQDAPVEDRIEVDMRYATCSFKRAHAPDAATPQGNEAVICEASAEMPLPGLMLAQEDDRWIVTLAGYADDSPPLTLAGFIERAQRMASAELATVVRDGEPLSDPVGFRFAASQRRHYERLLHFPAGLLVMGDALCSINPIHGQGMTLAACQALALRDALRFGEDKLSDRFFRSACRIVDLPWKIAAATDLALRPVSGRRSLTVRLRHAWTDRVFAAASRDAWLARAYLVDLHMLASPAARLRARMTWRVLRGDRAADANADRYKVRLRTR